MLQALEDQQEREEEFEQATGGEEQHAGTGVDVGAAERGARRAEQERRVAGDPEDGQPPRDEAGA